MLAHSGVFRAQNGSKVWQSSLGLGALAGLLGGLRDPSWVPEGMEMAPLSQNSFGISPDTVQLCLYWKSLLEHGVNGADHESPQPANDETPSLCLNTVCVGCLSTLTSLKIQRHRNVTSIFWAWLRSSIHSSNQCLQNTYCVPLCTAAVFSEQEARLQAKSASPAEGWRMGAESHCPFLMTCLIQSLDLPWPNEVHLIQKHLNFG